MSCELEQSHDTDDREELQDIGILQVGSKLLENEVDVEGQRGNVVDDIYGGFDKLTLAR